jgi:hypothetical protein
LSGGQCGVTLAAPARSTTVLAVIGVKAFGILCSVIAAVAGLIAIYQFVFKPHIPVFSGNVTTYTEAGNLISFLAPHVGQHVNVHVTCNDRDGCALASGPGGTPEMTLYASTAAVRCWPSGGPCAGGALLTFVPGSSGSLPSNGAGNLSVEGTWSLQKVGSGGTSPEGDPTYKLTG